MNIPEEERLLYSARFVQDAFKHIPRNYSGAPYFVHLARVAGRVASLPNSSIDMVDAAFKHDYIEDIDHISYAERVENLQECSPQIVVDWVIDLTAPSTFQKHLRRKERKKMDREHYGQCCVEVRTIKLIDRIDNLWDMPIQESFTKVYARESWELLEALRGTDKVLEKELEEILYRIERGRKGIDNEPSG